MKNKRISIFRLVEEVERTLIRQEMEDCSEVLYLPVRYISLFLVSDAINGSENILP